MSDSREAKILIGGDASGLKAAATEAAGAVRAVSQTAQEEDRKQAQSKSAVKKAVEETTAAVEKEAAAEKQAGDVAEESGKKRKRAKSEAKKAAEEATAAVEKEAEAEKKAAAAAKENEQAQEKAKTGWTKYSEQLKTTGKDLEKFGGQLRDVGGSLASVGAQLLASAGIVIAGFGAMTKSGVDFNLTVNSAEMALTRITGSSEKAAALIALMRKEALTSKLELKELLPLGTQLAALYGPDGIGKVLPTLRAFGDAATLLAANDPGAAERALLQFRQLASRERPAQQDLTQIESNLPGVGIRDILRKEFGTADLDVLRKSNVTGMQIADAIVKGMQERFGGAQQELAGTIPVLGSNIGDAFNELTGQLTEDVMPQLTLAFKTIVEGLQGLAQDKDAVAALSEPFQMLGEVLAMASGMLAGLLHWFQSLPPEAQHFTVQVVAVGTALTGVAGVLLVTVGGFLAFAGSIVTAVGAVATFAPAAVAAVSGAAAAVTPFIPAILGVVAAITALVVAVSTNFGGIRDFLQNIADQVGGTLGRLASDMGVEWKRLSDNIRETVETLGPVVTPVLRFIAGQFTWLWESIKSGFLLGLALLEGILRGGLTALSGLVNGWVKLLAGDWEGGLKELEDAWGRMWDRIIESITPATLKARAAMLRSIAALKESVGMDASPQRNEAAAIDSGADIVRATQDMGRGGRMPEPFGPKANPLRLPPVGNGAGLNLTDTSAAEKAAREAEQRRKFAAQMALDAMSTETVEARRRKELAEAAEERREKEAEARKLFRGQALTEQLAAIQKRYTERVRAINESADKEQLQAQTEAQQRRLRSAEQSLDAIEAQARRRAQKAGATEEGAQFAGLEARRKALEGFVRNLTEEGIGREGTAKLRGDLTDLNQKLGERWLKAQLEALENGIQKMQQSQQRAGLAPDVAERLIDRSRAQALRGMEPQVAGRVGGAALQTFWKNLFDAEEKARQADVQEIRNALEQSRARADVPGGDRAAEETQQRGLLTRLLEISRTEAERLAVRKELRDLDRSQLEREDQATQQRTRSLEEELDRLERIREATLRLDEAQRRAALAEAENRGPAALRTELASQQEELARQVARLTPVPGDPAGENEPEEQRLQREEKIAKLRAEQVELTRKLLELDKDDADVIARVTHAMEQRSSQQSEDQQRATNEATEAEERAARSQAERGGRRVFGEYLANQLAEVQRRIQALTAAAATVADETIQAGMRATLAGLKVLEGQIKDELSRVSRNWRLFWKDLGNQANEDLKGAAGGFFEGLLSGQENFKSAFRRLLTDLRGIAARALSNILVRSLETGAQNLFSHLFGNRGGNQNRPAGGGAGGATAGSAAGGRTRQPDTAGAVTGGAGGGEGSGKWAATIGMATGALITLVAAFQKGGDGIGSMVPLLIAALVQLVLAIMLAKAEIAAGPAGMIAAGVAAIASIFSNDDAKSDSVTRAAGARAFSNGFMDKAQVGRWGFDMGTHWAEGFRDRAAGMGQPSAPPAAGQSNQTNIVNINQHNSGPIHRQVDLSRANRELADLTRRALR